MNLFLNPLYRNQLLIYSDIDSPVPFNCALNCFNFINSDYSIFNKGGSVICLV